ncbi:hypothetical protein LTR10_018473 [Elasticomyces elasticus]|uniref:N-acetyltransferase domain-containing protein n=1 Tax=Exophiala sideris TaxID=1016849 RepID=A0ABR0J163_9EURO|nr:hypothetical protein LTR10_018473 [Elasticomyces elasticus]KAK5023936.1 hypothetical protein LTS07_009062 [Exophiala sideris]KAK5030048.1 hypothetical protein LTR13_008360 [Exophiala sideris]KAK5053543.1 hypothetical protein LTR69_009187 [Exophiala sideris]KAK5179416.1 hypothetical protein LTR44_008255 [Eurotiomycetes sp. CCFEE 6388]
MPSTNPTHPDIPTERLILRLFNPSLPSDYDNILHVYNSPHTIALTGDAGVHTPEDVDRRCSRQPLTSTDPSIVLPTHPYHLVYLRSDNTHVGSYTTLEEHTNQGYATEAAKAALKWWTEEMKVENIWAGVFATNKASQRVAQKIGLVDGGKITVLMPGDLTKVALVFVQPHMQTNSLDGMVLDVRRKTDVVST